MTDAESETRAAISAMRDEFTSGNALDQVFTEWLAYWASLGNRLELASTRLNTTADAWINADHAGAAQFGGR